MMTVYGKKIPKLGKKVEKEIHLDDIGIPFCPICDSKDNLEYLDGIDTEPHEKHLGNRCNIRLCKKCNVVIKTYMNVATSWVR